MNGVLEKVLLYVLGQLITPEVVKQFEKEVVVKLRALAADTSTKVDDTMVEIIAEALGVS
jgi:hypothetical protein